MNDSLVFPDSTQLPGGSNPSKERTLCSKVLALEDETLYNSVVAWDL